MQNHPSAWPFLQPVNRDEVTDYYDVIKEPMDLSTMEEKHEADLYPTPEDFIKDAKLIYDNCRKYNNETTPYAKSANKLEKFMWSKIKEIPEWSVSFASTSFVLWPLRCLATPLSDLPVQYKCDELTLEKKQHLVD